MNVEVFDFNLGITPEDALKQAYNGEQIRKNNATIPWKNDEEIYHPAELEGIEIVEGETVTIKKGSMVRLHLSSIPSIATLPSIAWMSSDQNIAVVDSNGIVHGISEGEVTVTAVNINDNNMVAEVTATVTSGSEHDYSKDYFTTVILEDSTITFTIAQFTNTDTFRYVSYSINDGEWVTTENQDDKENRLEVPVEVSNGDVVRWKCDATVLYKLDDDEGCFFKSTGRFEVEGNIMSLLYGDDFSDKTTMGEGCFKSLFTDGSTGYATTVTNASNLILPSLTLTPHCYKYMFSDCTDLTTAPKLPATTIMSECYFGMFSGCTSLTTAPELPATTLANNCYGSMFSGCTSLTTAPELPATTLAENCYDHMFDGCTGITTAPKLSATTLADYCYQSMFKDCTNLTTAPELPATTLPTACYSWMFKGCTSLNYIKCLATDISAQYCTSSWVDNVAPTGTFVKNASMQSWTTGNNGIPEEWTVE